MPPMTIVANDVLNFLCTNLRGYIPNWIVRIARISNCHHLSFVKTNLCICNWRPTLNVLHHREWNDVLRFKSQDRLPAGFRCETMRFLWGRWWKRYEKKKLAKNRLFRQQSAQHSSGWLNELWRRWQNTLVRYCSLPSRSCIPFSEERLN